MELHPESALKAVHWTARISAATFVLFLFSAGIRRWRSPSGRARIFLLFLLAHTVHFGAVLTLAWAVDGENIRSRGGWIPNIVVAIAFYAGSLWVWRSVRRADGGWFPEIAIAVLWLAFLQAYAFRIPLSIGFAVPTLALAAAYAVHIGNRRSHPVGRDAT